MCADGEMQRAKDIRNTVRVNKQLTPTELMALVRGRVHRACALTSCLLAQVRKLESIIALKDRRIAELEALLG